MAIVAMEPWERLPEETSVAFAAFAQYRALQVGDRSTYRVAQALSKSSALMRRWSSRHYWVARVRAWDAEQDRITLARLSKEIQDARDRHVTLGRALQGRAAARITEGWAVPDGLVAHVAKVGVDMENMGLGQATTRVEAAVDARLQVVEGGSPIMERLFQDPEKKARMLQIIEEVAAEDP